jgi:hypothetical protein
VTVIAWDGRTLAADKRAIKYGLAYTCRKIFRVGDRLVGIIGDAGRGSELVHWLESGGALATYPELRDKEQPAYLICIERDGRVLNYETSPHPYTVEDAFWADGEGRDVAIAAMAMGLDARAAVELTCRFISSCGNGVDTLSFDAP